MTGSRWGRLLAAGLGMSLTLAGCTGGGDDTDSQAALVATEEAADASRQASTGAATTGARVAAVAAPMAAPETRAPTPKAVNGFIPTATDNLSTFALDADTGSYSFARNLLGLDQVPASDAVRVEEFVNWFEHDLGRPDGPGLALTVDGAASPFFRAANHRLVRVGIATKAIEAADRKSAALTFVIDVSGSMADTAKLDLAKSSLKTLTEQLRDDDTVAIVTYSEQATVRLPATKASEDETILRAIDALGTEGGTNVEAGVRKGFEVARAAFRRGAINRLILASDGVANQGITDPDGILKTAQEEAGNGINLTTIGFGMGEYRDDLMEQLADKGDGFYAYVGDQKQAERLFVTHLTSTLEAQAIEAKVQVEFDPRTVTSYRLVGYENRAVADDRFRDDSVDGGELGAGHAVVALYEVELAGSGGSGALGTVTARWLHPETRAASEVDATIASAVTAGAFADAPPRLQLAATAAAFAEVLRRSPYAPSDGLQSVAAEASRLTRLLSDDPDVADLERLVAKAAAILRP